MIESMTSERILYAWELGINRSSIDRALVLLWAGMPEHSSSHADLPLGLRDRHLLELRGKTFGDVLNCKTECPRCEEVLEFSLSVSVLSETLSIPTNENLQIGEEEFQLTPLTSRHMAEAAGSVDPEEASDMLREKICGRHASDIPETFKEELKNHIERRESGSELPLSFTCVNCDHRWSERFNIGNFFWIELEAKAKRLLAEISEIARTFGWSEKDILDLSPHRRQSYLSFVRGG